MLSVRVDFIILMTLSGEQDDITLSAVFYNIVYRVLAALNHLVFGCAINSTQDIEQAKKNLEYARAQKGAIQRASLQYEQVRSEVPQEVQKAFDKHNQRMKASSWVVPIALVIVIIISLMLFMLLH